MAEREMGEVRQLFDALSPSHVEIQDYWHSGAHAYRQMVHYNQVVAALENAPASFLSAPDINARLHEMLDPTSGWWKQVWHRAAASYPDEGVYADQARSDEAYIYGRVSAAMDRAGIRRSDRP